MEASGMDGKHQSPRDDYRSERLSKPGSPDGAVLSALGDSLHQRDGRNRNPRASGPDGAGHVFQDCEGSCRACFPDRFLWASGSDYIGRRNTYSIFFAAQLVLFLLIPGFASFGQWAIFEASLFLVFTMYGGGFATIPAFLADIFGPESVGAIHGALLTAWSVAAVTGPVIITYLSDRAKAVLAPGASRIHIYDMPLRVLAALLAVGFVLTLLVRPLPREK
jgi:hypothetical protein